MKERILTKYMLWYENGQNPYEIRKSAITAGCDYFLFTDDRLLKYETNEMTLMNPVDFIKDVKDEENDE